MAANTRFITENELRNAPLPNHGGKYSIITHGAIIDQTRAELKNAGFGITRELYKSNKDGQIAQGIYHLDVSDNPDMGMMFAWSNSYNKMMRFKCAIGAQVFICMNGVVSGDMGSYARKHVGTTAFTDAVTSIQSQIKDAYNNYRQVCQDKEMLKTINLTRKDQCALLGRLFADEEILTPTQTSIVKREIILPTYNYNADKDSAWAFYNHVTLALKESHPINYLSDHQKVHSFFVNEFGQLVTPNINLQEIDEEAVEDNGIGVTFA